MPAITVAPMLDVTDRHCRYFLRQLAPRVGLYTEMVTARAVLHGDRRRLLSFNNRERPLALQLAGHEPLELAEAARIAAGCGYDEINLNVGCPSARVHAGRFGACLMTDPDLVARGVAAMRAAVTLPVTVKTRIGVDEHDGYDFLAAFVARVASAGCSRFIVHARKAYLQGLSPAENRSIPPLRYDVVYRLKQDRPDLHVTINGGISCLEDIAGHLARVDGVMLGRKAIEDPCFLARVEQVFLRAQPGAGEPDRAAVVRAMYEYARVVLPTGVRLSQVTRPMLGLYHGMPGARSWRRFLAERACRGDARPRLLLESLAVFDGVRAA